MITYLDEEHQIYQEPLDWQRRGLQYTATGYGGKIPTSTKLYLPRTKRHYRIYATCYSNAASRWIVVKGKKLHLH